MPALDDIAAALVRAAGSSDLPPALAPLGLEERAAALLQETAELRERRADVRARRERLHQLATEMGLSTAHTERRDHIGPFTVEHTGSQSTIRFGELAPRVLEHPSAEQVLALIEGERERLERGARQGLGSFLDALCRAQARLSPAEPVPWPELIKAVEGRPPAKDVLLYRLALLRSQAGAQGWRSQISPPTLAEQKRAWHVPSLDRANDPERVYRIRLLPPGTLAPAGAGEEKEGPG